LVSCYAHSRRAYRQYTDVGAQYQMREVEYVTRALLPACIITVLLRAFSVVMALYATFFVSFFPTYVVFMTTYHCIQTFNSSQYGLVIILIHESMRRKAVSVLLRCCGLRTINGTARISDLDKRKENHGAAYFDQLR
ncbi:hypothetical protein PENTCL1PPCAC_21078, partial [Pristionchus entomophagus]